MDIYFIIRINWYYKWAPLSILHNFTSTDVIALRACPLRNEKERSEKFNPKNNPNEEVCQANCQP